MGSGPPAAGAQGSVEAATTGRLLSSASVHVRSCMLCLAKGTFFVFLLVLLVDNGILGGLDDHPSWQPKY